MMQQPDCMHEQSKMNPWKTLSRRTILERKPFLSVELHAVETSNGQVIPDWTWIVSPDYVNVLAQTVEGSILCFRQTKYAVGGVSLAPIGGFIESGESAEAAAKRELLEETGYEGQEWKSLGSYAVDANRGVGRAHFFIARHARRVDSPIAGDLEEQTLLLLSRADIERALIAGDFKVLPWVAMVALGLRLLD